ncbi:MAG: hypothetical protein GY703_01370, partial [Gammaproteobacteria bacterium]|nr:hypothetical protein [Gammaproteobacteria bacterium]
AELFGNLGDGLSTNVAVTATGNWWGAADGPGGVGPGSGDSVTANVDYTDFLTDGSEFSWFNAGGDGHDSYQLNVPVMTGGTASTQWGSGAMHSVLSEFGEVPITAEYANLSPGAGYRLIVSYLNNDSGSSRQRILDRNGETIHGPVTLPATTPQHYQERLPKSAYDDGTLKLEIERVSGPRTLVSGLFLVQDSVIDSSVPSVSIASPANSARHQGGLTMISGTATDTVDDALEVEVGVQPAGGEISWSPVTEFQSSNGGWSYRWNPEAGDYLIQARATDDQGNRGISAIITITIDDTSPAAVRELNIKSVAGALRAVWLLSVDDGMGAGDVSYYRVLRSQWGISSFAEVAQVNAGLNRYDDLGVIQGAEYFYNVQAVDLAGNTTDSVIFGPVIPVPELDVTPPEDVTAFSAEATYVNGVTGAALLSWTGSTDTAGDLIDQRLAISSDGGASYGSNAPDYDNGLSISLGRGARRHYVDGLAIGASYRFKITTIDLVPNESAGSEVDLILSASPSDVMELSGSLSADTTLGAGVFKISSGLTIPTGVTLTLGPGAVLKFAYQKYLFVNGTLRAVGTDSNPVVFTALTDDSYGGDTNDDGPSSGTPGYWYGIRFQNSAPDASNRLEHSLVRYGGYTSYGNVYIDRTNITVKNSVIELGSHVGIRTNNASPTIEGNTIRNNASHGIYMPSHGAAKILDNIIEDNVGHGIYSQYGTPTIDGNQITGHSGYGVYHYDNRTAPRMVANQITGNGYPLRIPFSALPDDDDTVLTPNINNHVYLFGNNIGSDRRLRIWGKDTGDELSTYVIIGGDTDVPAYTTLTIDPGVVVKFSAPQYFYIHGSLIAEGTAEEKIVFTSYLDDTAGGDTNGDGDATSPVNGAWRSLIFYDSLFEFESHVEHAVFRYGGYVNAGAIYFQNADILFENSEVSNSLYYGIYVYNASPEIIGNRIWGNWNDGIRVEHNNSAPRINFNVISTNGSEGIQYHNNGHGSAANNEFILNRGYGLYNGTGYTIDASNSWWGDIDSSGPNHSTTNTTGTGDAVSDNVTYLPYQTEPPMDYGYTGFSAATHVHDGSIADPVIDQGIESDEWGTQPDRSMVYDDDTVTLAYSGLAADKRYKVRVSYFNGDSNANSQSLTDGNGDPIHGVRLLPTGTPVQHEFRIPQAYHADGNLTLNFNRENTAVSTRVAVPEVWLIEDRGEIVPPLFEAADYDDVDGNGLFSEGDRFYFHFSAALDDTLLVNGTTDANDHLVVTGGLVYGTSNIIEWSDDRRTVVVTLSSGFTVAGSETVTPTGLTGIDGLTVLGIQTLGMTDQVAPQLTGLDWGDNDGNGSVSAGDHYLFHFSEAMETSVIQDGTTNANAHLRPEGGARYGDINGIQWSADGKDLTVSITSGYTIIGNELVSPSTFLTDKAGNRAVGSLRLLGRDDIAPLITAVRFDDADGSGSPSIGDRWFFDFDETMLTAALSDGTPEANLNLTPDDRIYGEFNRIQWNIEASTVSVEVTGGFTVTGTETVYPGVLLTDRAGNPVGNNPELNLNDVISPEVERIDGFYISPVSATDDYKLTVQFNSRMDTSVEPVITLSGSGGTDPVVPGGGSWLTTRYGNDTYTTPDITLALGMDGTVSVAVSDAQDWNGNSMVVASDLFSFDVDATPPGNPVVTLGSTGCDNATLTWSGYAAPADLTSFQVYRENTGSFSTVDGVSFLTLIGGGQRSYQLTGLSVDTPYDVAVVALDGVGNFDPDVTSLPVFIDRPVPVPVTISVAGDGNPGTARVDWSGYDTAGQCGFAGFRVYREESDFSDVTGLTPVAVLGDQARSYSLSGLDRSKNYYFAVVGYNTAAEVDNEVTTAVWTDPFTGDVTSDLTIGAGSETEIDIHQTLRVVDGATLTIVPGTVLRFAPGAGIETVDGKIVVQGTALQPILLTSLQDVPGGSPAPGDWIGVILGAGDTGSVMEHLVIHYAGAGLHVNGAPPLPVAALVVRYDSGAGLHVSNGGSVTATESLLRYNAIGARVDTGGQLTISGSVLKNNATNAFSDDSTTLEAGGNWWGALSDTDIGQAITGDVDFSGFLSYEPVLMYDFDTASGEFEVTTPDQELIVAAQLADEMRFSEDSSFDGVFYQPFADTTSFQLSEGGGPKTIYGQFRSATGAESTVIHLDLNYITDGPVVELFSLADGQVITRPIDVTGQAHSVLGLSSLEFHLDDELIASAPPSSLDLNYRWDVREAGNGIHRVKLLARDTAGRIGTREHNVTLAVVAPPPPVITNPPQDQPIPDDTITVSGSSEPFIQMQLRRNGFVVGTVMPAADGLFAFDGLALSEGENRFIANAVDSIGQSASSNTFSVLRDSGPPSAPVLETPVVIQGEGIYVRWRQADTGEPPTRYRLYRSTVPFSDPQNAAPIVDQLTQLTYSDRFLADGTYYYAVVGEDDAGNASGLSNVLGQSFDGTPPVFSLTFGTASPAGVGDLTIDLESSEPLSSVPGVTVTPAGGRVPVAVAMSRVDDLHYSGVFEITPETVSGTALFSVSGSDLSGNSYVGAPAAPDLVIDTAGPAATLTTDAVEPVQVLSDVAVNVTLNLDEPAGDGVIPSLRFQPPEGIEVQVPLLGNGATWNGILTLNNTMGVGIGQFIFSASDSLGNIGTRLISGGELEVFNTAVPQATDAPMDFNVESRPGGEVLLNWGAVDKAETYRVYRSNSDCSVTPDVLVATDLTILAHLDLPDTDGVYCYGVATDRLGAESPLSILRPAASDRVAPSAPANPAIALQATGVQIQWDRPGSGEMPAYYRLYRDGVLVRTIHDSSAQVSVLDYPATGGSYSYTIGSLDQVGNESLTAPLVQNLLVGAVTDLQAYFKQGEVPLLVWTSNDGSVIGYNVYRGGVKLNTAPKTETRYIDDLFAGSSTVEYGVSALNGEGDEGPVRSLKLLPLAIEVISNPDGDGVSQPLLTSYFNNLGLEITNNATTEPLTFSRLGLDVSQNDELQYSIDQEMGIQVEPGTSYGGTLAVPSGASSEAWLVESRVVQENADGSRVFYEQDQLLEDFEVTPSPLNLTTLNASLAGGISTVQVCINNYGYSDISVVVTREFGAAPGDVQLALFNDAGLEIGRTAYEGSPEAVLFDAAGNGHVNIEPGTDYCLDVEILVPISLQENDLISFVAEVEKFNSGIFGTGENSSTGLKGALQSSVSLTAYYGSAQSDKPAYANNDSVVITGQAIDRLTGDPLANTDLKVGFYLDGFKWFERITTDESGNYTHVYKPTPGLSGEFIVWAAHPAVFDVIEQARFGFFRLYLSPEYGSIRSAKNDTLEFALSVRNPGKFPLSDFSYEFRAFTIDGDNNEVDEPTVTGTVTFPAGFTVAPGASADITLSMSAAIDAPDDVNLEYRVLSGNGAVGTFQGTASLTEAVPVLIVSSPDVGYVDQSVNRGSIRTVPVTLKNNGLRDLVDARVTLPQTLNWITTNRPLNSAGEVELGTLPVGAEATFDVVIAPPADVAFGYVDDSFLITGSNTSQVLELNVYTLITSSEQGSVQFVVHNFLGQLVADAKIRMKNDTIREEITPVVTNEDGEVLIEGLQVGNWSWQVSAAGHGTEAGTVSVLPDQTVLVDPELTRNLVTINFTVVPVPLTDRYEIKIEQQFDTHLPMPVLVVDPPLINGYWLEPGYEETHIVRVSNYGLKALDDVRLTPADSGEARWEPLVTYIPRLAPLETIEVPFKFTYRGTADFSQLPGTGSAVTTNDLSGGLIAGIPSTLSGDLDGVAVPPAGLASDAKDFYDDVTDCHKTPIKIKLVIVKIVGWTKSAYGDRLVPIYGTTAFEFDDNFNVCDIIEDLCKEGLGDALSPPADGSVASKIGGYAAKKLADKFCGAVAGGLKLIPHVAAFCAAFEKIDKAWKIGKAIGCALRAVAARAGSGGPSGGSTGGGGGGGGFFSSFGGGGGSGFCAFCGPRIGTAYERDGCFAAGTPILMADGSRQAIESVLPGDMVATFDGGNARVKRVKVRDTDHLRELRFREIGGEQTLRRITTTDEHRFWAMNRDRWLLAGDIQVGDRLMLVGGTEAVITATRRYSEETKVYNFDVVDYETYFANDVLVYQDCNGQTARRVDDRLRAWLQDNEIPDPLKRLLGNEVDEIPLFGTDQQSDIWTDVARSGGQSR